MKYLALALALSLAAFVGVAQGINCWVCEDAEGNRAPCDGTNEQDKACGAYTIGCVEEVAYDKASDMSKTMRFCLESTAYQKSAISSYFAPMIADRVEAEADELAAKGCMRWNTDKYTIGIFGCDTDNCNKDLDQGDCAHVCEEKKETGMEKPQVKEQDEAKALPSNCWSCTREENGEIINTLCSDTNLLVAECAPGSAGCVEFTYDFGPNIHHELRHCVDRAAVAASEVVVGPRDLIPVAAFDDEVYAKGCLKYYNVNFQSDVCICDEDECNLDCDCKYECDSVFSTPSPKEH